MTVNFMKTVSELSVGDQFVSDLSGSDQAYAIMGMDPRVPNTRPCFRFADGGVVDVNENVGVTQVRLKVVPE